MADSSEPDHALDDAARSVLEDLIRLVQRVTDINPDTIGYTGTTGDAVARELANRDHQAVDDQGVSDGNQLLVNARARELAVGHPYNLLMPTQATSSEGRSTRSQGMLCKDPSSLSRLTLRRHRAATSRRDERIL